MLLKYKDIKFDRYGCILDIENSKTESFAKSFDLLLKNIKNPKSIEVLYNGQQLNYNLKNISGSTILSIEFEDAVVGEGKKRKVSITFTLEDLSSKSGEVWEINIPKLSNDNPFSEFEMKVSVPKSFGEEAYISPLPVKKLERSDSYLYEFAKSDLENFGVSAAFGKFQVFSFVINYNVEGGKKRYITLPPDTPSQRIFYENINPHPDNVFIDPDGNWIAEFNLSKSGAAQITAIGNVQIFAEPISFFTPDSKNLNSNLAASPAWPVNDPKIYELASKLESIDNIYQFVLDSLTYDYTRLESSVKRNGAIWVLDNPKKAICLEFTDLFITLSRAAGIPAREINGYAYTENPKIQPLSLVADVLHAWPEYYDYAKKTWVAVDPTWESTSGVDYFTKMDLRHFAFVIHGESFDSPPSPGTSANDSKKDIFVNFGKLPSDRSAKIEIKSESKIGTNLKRKIKSKIINNGPNANYNLLVKLKFDDRTEKEYFLEAIPPFGEIVLNDQIPFSFLASGYPNKITIEAGDESLMLAGYKSKDQLYQIALFTHQL